MTKKKKWCEHIKWRESISTRMGTMPATWAIRVDEYIWDAIPDCWEYCPLCGAKKK